MLTRMKLKVVAARTLLYETTKMVDLRQCYTHLMETTPVADLSQDVRDKQKFYNKAAAVLTPMSKAYCTEIANEV
ncbi:MAG: hypothetical protein KAG97_07490, partial [Victivallales bacterium]|nr:hypothetical protein [Victivallales bacterium]